MRAALIVLLLTFATQAGAENKQTNFGGVILNLPKPDNLCVVENYGSTSEIFEMQSAIQRKAGNKLLAFYDDCLHLESAINGSEEANSPEWQFVVAYDPNSDAETIFKNYSTQRFNEEISAGISDLDINEFFKRAEQGVNQTLKDFSYDGNIVFGKPIDLGVLEIGDAVFQGMIVNISNGNDDFLVGGIFSYLLVNGVFISAYKYKKYKSKQTMIDLLSDAKFYVAKVVHLN